MEVVHRSGEVGGIRTHWLSAPGGEPAPILYVHGVPTASWDWTTHLERSGGIAPDLPGFGESARPDDFAYTIDAYVGWLEAFVDAVGLERYSLVAHDWGGLGLALAQRHPDRVERIVLHSCVPLLPGYRWHRVARIWRAPVLGEVFMASATRWAFRQFSREANAAPGPLPDWFVERVWAAFDRGTRRAILRLYRSAPERELARAGARLGELRCPALVLWPSDDPYIPARFGAAYAEALGGETTLETVAGAGHWSWIDRPELVERVAEFLSGG